AYLQEFGEVELPPGMQTPSLAGVERTEVPVQRLDTLVEKMSLPAPSVLKIDIEGAEAAALAGAEKLLAQYHPAIICEVHGIEAALAVADRLAGMGYVMRVLGKNGPHVACFWNKDPGI
ncbi:MAG: FkbM family methyltransferase, partial [Chloroflexia bacterium]